VLAALAVCRRHRVLVLGRGCGTGLAGQSVNAGVVFDFSNYMHEIVDLDPVGRTARVQPGVICDDLRAAAAEHGLTYTVDPATHDRCTFGGMIGNNSCGTHSVMGGKTVDNVLSLDVVTYDGTRMTVGPTDDEEYARILAVGGRRAEIYRRCRELAEHNADRIRDRFPDVPRRVSGYNLDDLLPEKGFNLARALVGTESTCVLVLEATVRLLPDPAHHTLLVVGYPDAATAADHVPELADTGVIGLECFDAGVLRNIEAHGLHIPGMDELPEGGAWLLAEYGADDQDEAKAQVEDARKRVTEPGVPKVVEDAQHQTDIWEVRRSTIEFTRIPGEHAGLAGWEDGRARLLMEMMSGHEDDVPNRGWRDPHVKEALDLCLACKGCKGDCPVNVDMATYKAEFLSHHYAGRLRPRVAYALGLIPLWARAASVAPGLVNAALAAPLLGGVAKRLAGVDPRREVPTFAARTFRSWFAEHPPRAAGEPVLLWPDTFTDRFQPEVGVAAVEVLEAAGFRVQIPGRVLCCGRPLYDYGMLPTARRWLTRIVEELREPIRAGIPLVALEPSCLAVFRDELRNLLPADADAARLAAQAVSLAELLDRVGYQPPRLERTALVQRHCHQGAVIGAEADERLMAAMGLDVQTPDSGCCGMAGSFGYEAGEKYRVSQACGERVILPEVRAAAADTLVLADGFSCRSQIEQFTSRRGLHLAEAMAMGLWQGSTGPAGARPEQRVRQAPPRSDRFLGGLVAALGAGAALGGIAVWLARLRKH
jgi:FAD/FMN-containing dehydrogenase/Fe-S oxidoreductase